MLIETWWYSFNIFIRKTLWFYQNGLKEILFRSLYIINKNGLDAFHNNRHHYRLYVCSSMAARCKASVGMGNCSPKTLLTNYITQLTKIPNREPSVATGLVILRLKNKSREFFDPAADVVVGLWCIPPSNSSLEGNICEVFGIPCSNVLVMVSERLISLFLRNAGYKVVGRGGRGPRRQERSRRIPRCSEYVDGWIHTSRRTVFSNLNAHQFYIVNMSDQDFCVE